MSIVKSNDPTVQVGPSSERNKFHACFSLTKDLRSKPQGTQLWHLRWHSLCAMRGNMKLETPAVFCAKWMCVTLTESWGDKTCNVVVIWTRRNWQLVEHPRCDKTHEGREESTGENSGGEKAREGRNEKRGILSPLISLAPDISPAQRVITRCVFCRHSFQWASCAFTLHRRPQVFEVSNYGALQV